MMGMDEEPNGLFAMRRCTIAVLCFAAGIGATLAATGPFWLGLAILAAPLAWGLYVGVRIASPKRNLEVGKWYRMKWQGEWLQCIATRPEYSGGYFKRGNGDADWFTVEDIDWSASPRDEAMEDKQ